LPTGRAPIQEFDAVLAHSKAAVLNKFLELEARNERLRQEKKEAINVDAILNILAKDEDGNSLGFHNHSQLDFPKLKGDPDNIGRQLANYINGFS
jgi:type I restriction enzyme M protein